MMRFRFNSKRLLRAAVLMLVLATYCACTSDEMVTMNDGDATATLHLQTRAGDGGDAKISYPVSIYVFQDDACRAVQTVTSVDDDLNIPLSVGTYDVYAVSGASATDFADFGAPNADQNTLLRPVAEVSVNKE